MDLIGAGVNRLCQYARSGDFVEDVYVELSPTVTGVGTFGVPTTVIEVPVTSVVPVATAQDLIAASVNRLCQYSRSGNFLADMFTELTTSPITVGTYGVPVETIQLPVTDVTPVATTLDMITSSVNRLCQYCRTFVDPDTGGLAIFDFPFDGGLG